MIDTKNNITLPYAANSKILIAGGHESWLRMFSKMVTGKVKYIPRNKPGYSPAAINKYDFVVFQNNAISHSNYGKLMSICKSKGIPVVYFSQASAKKCVCELVEYDQKYSA